MKDAGPRETGREQIRTTSESKRVKKRVKKKEEEKERFVRMFG